MGNPSIVQYNVIGLMSGTSLDGLDLAACTFFLEENRWRFELLASETIPYSAEWKNRLLSLEHTDAMSFHQTHAEYGNFLGLRVADFIIKHQLKIDFIASHGHTIFHQPEKKFTVQVGAGSAIAAKCALPVVCDFRSPDVALGGQGAPLVPIGDRLLFSEYDQCLNLGGFANISFEHKDQRIAFDICPVNILLNPLAEKLGKAYDENGNWAREGMVSNYFLNELNQLSYYKQIVPGPRSLGKEWVIQQVQPLLDQYELETTDLLRTITEHAAIQIARILNEKGGRVLVTGGGAYNEFLLERIRALSKAELVIPDRKIIEFKEAIIFGFLGVLRIREENNCLSSVTGALRDHSSGAIYWK